MGPLLEQEGGRAPDVGERQTHQPRRAHECTHAQPQSQRFLSNAPCSQARGWFGRARDRRRENLTRAESKERTRRTNHRHAPRACVVRPRGTFSRPPHARPRIAARRSRAAARPRAAARRRQRRTCGAARAPPPAPRPAPAQHHTRARAAAAPRGAHFARDAALEVDEHAKPRVLTVGELQQLERRVEDVAECADRAHNRLELGSSVEDNDARCSSRAQPPQRPHWRSTMPHGLSRCGQV